MKKLFIFAISLLVISASFVSCKKEPDFIDETVKEIPVGNKIDSDNYDDDTFEKTSEQTAQADTNNYIDDVKEPVKPEYPSDDMVVDNNIEASDNKYTALESSDKTIQEDVITDENNNISADITPDTAPEQKNDKDANLPEIKEPATEIEENNATADEIEKEPSPKPEVVLPTEKAEKEPEVKEENNTPSTLKPENKPQKEPEKPAEQKEEMKTPSEDKTVAAPPEPGKIPSAPSADSYPTSGTNPGYKPAPDKDDTRKPENNDSYEKPSENDSSQTVVEEKNVILGDQNYGGGEEE